MPEADTTTTYKDIPGFPGYRCGDDGSVWSSWVLERDDEHNRFCSARSSRWRRMKPFCDPKGYPAVHLCRDGRVRQVSVHRLVLSTFVGPCPPGHEGCHFPDRNPANNALSNLRWDSRKANKADMVAHGTRLTGDRHGRAKLTADQVRDIRRRLATGGVTRKAVAREYGVHESLIRHIVRHRIWKDV